MSETFLITGTSQGLGYELAKNLISKSHNVIGLSRKKGKASNFDSYSNFKYYKCDLSNISKISKICDKIKKENQSINTLINNSARFSMAPDKDIGDDELINIFQTNVVGTILLTRNIIRLNNKNLKRIFNILSVSGLNSEINQAVYSSTKHALRGYFNSLMQENIKNKTIINFYPGGMKTELWKKIKIDKQKIKNFMTAKNVSDYILSHLNLPKDIFIKEVTFFPKNDWH